MRKIVWCVVLVLLSYSLGTESAEAPSAGSFPPKSIQKQVRPLLKAIREAQRTKDEQEVSRLSKRVIQALGNWAANPDTKPIYYNLIDESKPKSSELTELWARIEKKLKKRALWIKVPDGDPDKMKTNLRQAARPVIAITNLYQPNLNSSDENLQFTLDGANYLLKLQRKNGLFPAPDLRDKDPYYASYNKRALNKNRNAIVNGWFVDDYRGELQFDNAVSGIAMLRAYLLTKDNKYLISARKSADWARQKNLDTNWTYNAFSVWFLSEFYKVTGENEYLQSAIEKVKLGVLPGQLPNGRWFDPVTSKLVYHAATVRGIISLYSQIEESELKDKLKHSIVMAVDNAAKQINTHGASSTTTSTEMLINAIEEVGYKASWDAALAININASLRYLNDKQAPWIGVFLSNYIVYQKSRQTNGK